MHTQHVFIIGSKGCANYGGYETFTDRLTYYHRNNRNITYHISWKGKEKKEFEYNNAHCFQIKVPNIGPAQAILYDIAAFHYCINYIKAHHINHPIIYILACRIGPFFKSLVKQVHNLGGMVYLNPDGHEWLRSKWSPAVRKYWKLSESLMVSSADLIVCDSVNIEKYILEEYKKYRPKTTYIAYGADLRINKTIVSSDFDFWLKSNELKPKQYYLIVGRFVPENSFEDMLREFMMTNTARSLVIITTENANYRNELETKLGFSKDKRIKFVGTVYDRDLLMDIRSNAYAYIHGHTVGGTNPSLIEALGSTQLNLLVDVSFNREVADSSALYWDRKVNSLSQLINEVDKYSKQEIEKYSDSAIKRISEMYTWDIIAHKYEKLFIEGDE